MKFSYEGPIYKNGTFYKLIGKNEMFIEADNKNSAYKGFIMRLYNIFNCQVTINEQGICPVEEKKIEVIEQAKTLDEAIELMNKLNPNPNIQLQPDLLTNAKKPKKSKKEVTKDE